MQLKQFADSFGPVKDAIRQIDGLVHQAGEHFNEAQQEQAQELVTTFETACNDAVSKAEAALSVDQQEAKLEASAGIVEEEQDDDEDEMDDIATREPQDGDVYVIRDGKPMRVVEQRKGALASALSTKAGVESMEQKPVIVGQGSQIGTGHITDDLTRTAVESIEKHLEDRRSKGSKPAPGVKTVQTGEVVDKSTGDAVGLAGSEGDQSTHHTDDGSRSITDAADAEGVKMLTADTLPQKQPSILDAGTNDITSAIASVQGGNVAHQYTESITADAPADTAAVQSGEQEVIPMPSTPEGTSGVVVDQTKEQPGVPSSLILHEGTDPAITAKSSGDGKNAGDWTQAGWDASGFPVAKGSTNDVS